MLTVTKNSPQSSTLLSSPKVPSDVANPLKLDLSFEQVAAKSPRMLSVPVFTWPALLAGDESVSRLLELCLGLFGSKQKGSLCSRSTSSTFVWWQHRILSIATRNTTRFSVYTLMPSLEGVWSSLSFQTFGGTRVADPLTGWSNEWDGQSWPGCRGHVHVTLIPGWHDIQKSRNWIPWAPIIGYLQILAFGKPAISRGLRT